MDRKMRIIKYALIVASVVYTGCFPNKTAKLLDQSAIRQNQQISAPTKIFLHDASVVLFKDGFQVKDDRLEGNGVVCRLNGERSNLKSVNIPMDSVAALTYYETESSAGSVLSSLLLGIYGGFLTPLSVYCLSCPKCCFGSCPTVYSWDGQNYILEAELFSYSISKFYQEADLDRLNLSGACLQNYRVRISNEALETHFIDQFALLKVDHPRGTQVYPSSDGDIICTGGLSVPGSVINSEGHDISDLVKMRDDCVYRSGEQLVQKISKNFLRDHIDCQLQFPEGTKTISLVLRLRNTLLTTILFYELVLSSQGAAALEWTQKMQNNFYYATIFNELYKSYAGITINTLKGDQWVPLTKIGDIGPIAWKEIAIEIPVEQEKNGVSLRLEFFPDNFMIDYVGYDCHAEFAYSPRISIQQPVSIVDDQKKNRADIENLLHDVDKKYLITNPGESYYLTYDLTSDDTLATSVFVKSKGYYIEWIRGSWLTNGSNDYHFSLFDIDKTLNHLRESWLENRPLIEDRFFETRIPLREEL